MANGGVQAPLPFTGSDNVPQAYTPLGQPSEPITVGQVHQRLDQCATEQRPELVGRVPVVLLQGQRVLAGEAAENQTPGKGVDDLGAGPAGGSREVHAAARRPPRRRRGA